MSKDTKSGCKMCNMDNNLNSPQDSCIPQELIIKNVRLAAAYVPYQQMCTLLSPLDALKHGTVFPELYSPYDGKYKNHKQDYKE